MTPTHSPLPWKVLDYRKLTYICRADDDKKLIAICGNKSGNQEAADAALIVTCVNSHTQLVEALEWIQGYVGDYDADECQLLAEWKYKAKSALAAAKGGQA